MLFLRKLNVTLEFGGQKSANKVSHIICMVPYLVGFVFPHVELGRLEGRPHTGSDQTPLEEVDLGEDLRIQIHVTMIVHLERSPVTKVL